MKQSKITMVKDAGGYHAGDQVTLDTGSAEALVALGYAESGSGAAAREGKSARGGGASPSR